jgi:hypothetical protein
MMRRLLLTAFALVPLLLSGSGCATTAKKQIDDSKLGQLASSVGISTQTAQGALGSMLDLTQRRVDTGQFQQITQYIPRAQAYIDGAQQMGAYQGGVRNAADLQASFAKLGMSPEQSQKFVAAVTSYLEEAGGQQVSSLLSGALSN